MFERFVPSSFLSKEKNEEGLNINKKLSLMEKLMATSGIDKDTDVDDEWFDRVDVVMAGYGIDSRDLAENLVALEYAVDVANGGQITEEILESAGEFAQEVMSDDFPHITDEENQVFINVLKQKISSGSGFLKGFQEAVEERKEVMSNNKGHEIIVDGGGLVQIIEENRPNL